MNVYVNELDETESLRDLPCGKFLRVMNSALKDGACRCPSTDLRGPTCGCMTGSPVRDVAGRCGICWAGESAAYAGKPVARRTVAAIYTAAFRARLAGISRVNADQGHATERCLVAHETPKLSKRPTVVRSPLALSNRCPGANVRQVFQPDAASGAFSLAHDYLADAVVHVGCEPRFLESAASQQPLGRVGSFPLKPMTKPRMATAQVGIVGTAGMSRHRCRRRCCGGRDQRRDIRSDRLLECRQRRWSRRGRTSDRGRSGRPARALDPASLADMHRKPMA